MGRNWWQLLENIAPSKERRHIRVWHKSNLNLSCPSTQYWDEIRFNANYVQDYYSKVPI